MFCCKIFFVEIRNEVDIEDVDDLPDTEQSPHIMTNYIPIPLINQQKGNILCIIHDAYWFSWTDSFKF